MNAIIKKHKQNYKIHNNTVLTDLFPSNSIIVANKSRNNLHQLIAQTDPCKIKTDLLDQTPHGYKRCGRKCDSCDNFILEETSFISFATGILKLEFLEKVLVTPKTLYI